MFVQPLSSVQSNSSVQPLYCQTTPKTVSSPASVSSHPVSQTTTVVACHPVSQTTSVVAEPYYCPSPLPTNLPANVEAISPPSPLNRKPSRELIPVHLYKPVGRKSTASQLSDETKAGLSLTIAKYGVSERNAGPLMDMWQSVMDYKSKSRTPSHSTMRTIMMDVYGRAFFSICDKIYRSTHLSLLIDGANDFHQRNPIAIQLSGTLDGEMWMYPIRFCEPIDHKAQTQLTEIEATFSEMNKLFPKEVRDPSKTFRHEELSVMSLFAIVFDTTSSNTGEFEGLAG